MYGDDDVLLTDFDHGARSQPRLQIWANMCANTGVFSFISLSQCYGTATTRPGRDQAQFWRTRVKTATSELHKFIENTFLLNPGFQTTLEANQQTTPVDEAVNVWYIVLSVPS